MNNEGAAADFPNSWREVLAEMEREWERLHQEIAELRTERAQLSRALFALLGDEPDLRDEEILAQIGHEKPFREFLLEMRAELVK